MQIWNLEKSMKSKSARFEIGFTCTVKKECNSIVAVFLIEHAIYYCIFGFHGLFLIISCHISIRMGSYLRCLFYLKK